MNARLKSYTSSSRCGPPAGVCIVDSSFAPLGLVPIPLSTHGLRRGLHSYAASRLTRNFASLHASQSRSEGLVLKPEEWLWSSFRHYAYGERGPVLVNEIRNAEFHIRKISRSHRHRSPPVKPPRVGHSARLADFTNTEFYTPSDGSQSSILLPSGSFTHAKFP